MKLSDNFRPIEVLPPTLLELYQPNLGPSDMSRPLKSQEKVCVVVVVVGGGENQKYCMAQVNF